MVATSTTTKEFRRMLHNGQGQPIPRWAKDEARAAMTATFRATGSAREACKVYEETLRAYGYEPDDLDNEEENS